MWVSDLVFRNCEDGSGPEAIESEFDRREGSDDVYSMR
jgi:hypothetical protein